MGRVVGRGTHESRIAAGSHAQTFRLGARSGFPAIASRRLLYGRPVLPDILEPGLRVVFVGTAKSTASAEAGHYYAHPQNMFWNLLEASGLTGGVFVPANEDRSVTSFGIGLTDLVASRAASSDSLLRAADFDVPGFVARIERFRPAVVAFNGGESARRVARHLGHAPPEEGPAGWSVAGSEAYRLPSSSSANATGGYESKRQKWVEFGRWVSGLGIAKAPG